MRIFRNLFLFLLLFVATFISGGIFVQAESIGPDTFDSGGGVSTDGTNILESSIGQIDSGFSSDGSNTLISGYGQDFSTGSYIDIAINPIGGVTMNEISGFMSGGVGDGSSDVKVTTDYDGYSLVIKSSTNPAFKCNTSSGCDESDSFANYNPSGGVGTPDYSWAISSNESKFGYTAKGADILSKFKYDTQNTSCGSGSSSSSGEYCWDAITTSDVNIASSSSSNYPDGVITNLKFRSQVGSGKLQPSGSYKASVTVTATAN